ncbi:MAG: heme ABC transporter permease [Woeseia sp.]|nr:heme ABC transporter permease [Woeseia sp.]
MWTWFHKLASPPHFFRISEKMVPWFGISGLLIIAWGTWHGLFVAPPDYQQGDAFRIIYVHVPSAYLSMAAYMTMALAAGIGLIWRIKLSHAVAAAAAPIGAWFTFLALATGMIWGRPMWGTWWEWGDPRLTSELLMLFLYFGYMALRAAISDVKKADNASGVLALVGAVNIPIIHYSVEWWSSLHQGATILREDGPAMPPEMLTPLLFNIAGFTLLFGALLLIRVRTGVIYREHRKMWVKNLIQRGEL